MSSVYEQLVIPIISDAPTLRSQQAYPTQAPVIYLRGIASDGDGQQGWFQWVGDSVANDDDLNVIQSNWTTGAGRWIRLSAFRSYVSTISDLIAYQDPIVGAEYSVLADGTGVPAVFVATNVAPASNVPPMAADYYFYIASSTTGIWFKRISPMPRACPRAQNLARLRQAAATNSSIVVNIFVPGDSRLVTPNTSGAPNSNCIQQLGANMALEDPNVNYNYYVMNTTGTPNFTPTGWSGSTPIQSGKTGGTINIWNGGVPGSTWQICQGVNTPLFFNSNVPNFDFILAAGGVNIGYLIPPGSDFAFLLGMLLFIQQQCPNAEMIISPLSPWLLHPNGDYMEASGIIQAAEEVGADFVDMLEIYYSIPYGILSDPANGYYNSDGNLIHPGPKGVLLLATCLTQAIQLDTAMNFSAGSKIAPMSVWRNSLLPDQKFYNWDYTAGGPSGMTFTNCTAFQNKTEQQTGAYALGLTSSGTSQAYGQLKLGDYMDVTQLRGKRVCFWAVSKAEAGTTDTFTGKIAIEAIVGGITPASFKNTIGGYGFQLVHLDVAENETDIRALFYASLNTDAQTSVFDRYGFFVGNCPSELNLAALGSPTINPGTLFDRANLVPFTTTVITGTDNNITATDSVGHQPRVSINLPQLSVNQTYIATWTNVAGTAGDAVIVTNAFNDGGTPIATTVHSANQIVWRSPGTKGCVFFTSAVGPPDSWQANSWVINTYSYSTPQVTPTGTGADTTEDVLQSVSVPNATFQGVGSGVTLDANGVYNTNGNDKTIKLYLGTLNISTGIQTANGLNWRMQLTVTKTAANTQYYFGTFTISGSAPTYFEGTAALTEASVLLAKVTGQNGTATLNDIICNFFSVTPFGGALS